MPKNWEARDKKLDKRRNGMRVSGRSIFTMDEAEKKRNREKVERAERLRKGQTDEPR